MHRLHGEREETAHAYEVNEAFAPVPLAWAHELGADPERLNPRGGAIALGRAPVASRWFTSLASRGVPEDPSVENGEQVGARVAELPLHEAVHRSVVEFNRFPTDASPTHRDRMRLILPTPELRAHSVHQYAAWRAAIAAYVARRTGQQPTDLTPRMGGYGLQAIQVQNRRARPTATNGRMPR